MSFSQRFVGCSVIVALMSALGCGSSGSSGSTSGGASMDTVSAQADAQEAARKREEQAAAAKAAEEKKAAEAQAAQAAQASAAAEMKKAGRSTVGPGGYYTAIVGARRHILNEAESWAWKQGVQHFRATEGRKPKDNDEFMKKIVIPLEINLGYKEENQEFYYDPNAESDGDLGVLYVVEKEPATPAPSPPQPPPSK